MTPLPHKLKMVLLASVAWCLFLEFSNAFLNPPYGHPLGYFVFGSVLSGGQLFANLLLPTVVFHLVQRAWMEGRFDRWRPSP